MSACEKVVESETCSQFRLDRPDLKEQFLRCDVDNPPVLTTLKACGQGLWATAKEYLSIFEAPELSPVGETFTELQVSCFADLNCRQKTYQQGLSGRKATADELKQLVKVPATRRLQVQPFYYGLLEQLRSMKTTELKVISLGLDPVSPEGQKAMRESILSWKPEYRALYAPEGWGESVRKTVTAVTQRLKEIGIELQCLDGPTVTEMLCFGAGYLVDPVVALKAATALPKAFKVIGKLIKAGRELKSAAILKIESRWGRSLTAEELRSVEQAHKIGALEKGVNGADAGLGNYTLAQLRRKYLALKDHFSPDEIRDLMESGAVGMNPREQALLRAQRPAPPSSKALDDPVPSNTVTDAAMKSLAEADVSTTAVRQELASVGKGLNRFPEFQSLQKQVATLERKQDQILEHWDASSTRSTESTKNEIANLQHRIDKAKAEADLWKKREAATDWKKVREAPSTVVPNRVYKVETDRGESLKVVFNDRVVREMVWDGSDSLRAKAGSTSIEALARGFQTSNGSNGINVLNLDGDKFIKIHITGKAIGAYRIYGVEKNGVIHFVNWEHESVHDSRYLRRSYENTMRAYEHMSRP